MKKQILIFLALAGVYTCSSQTVTPVLLSNDGDYTTLVNGSISWSIGEPVSETYSGPNNILTMGFHQPELAIHVLIQEQGMDSQILVYPNPVKEMLNVNMSGLATGNYKFEMTDALGKILFTKEMDITESNHSFELRVNEVAAGNYFLRVNGKNLSKSVKITKVN
jgi:hypothetical protein